MSPSLTPNGAHVNRNRHLTTTSQPSARVQALLNDIRQTAGTAAEKADAVYQYISSNNFTYSLTPRSLGDENQLERLLFETKEGYCEHYASAFTTLMRWLGVPARVVVGYQGGEIINANSKNPFLEVRYSDAHAWSEVWIDGQWQRVDPTAAVSSTRIDYGMDVVMQLWNDEIFGSIDTERALSDYLNPSGSTKFFRELRGRWKSVAFQWNKWVVNYDAKTQLELLKSLGFKHGNHLLTLVGILMASATILMLLYFLRLLPKPIKRSKEQAIYLKFVAKFKKLGLTKNISETPLEFSIRAIAAAPSQRQEIETITREYQQLRYSAAAPENLLNTFKKNVQAFTLNKANRIHSDNLEHSI